MSNIYEKLRELADNNGLKFIETTDGMNGYPKNLQCALIGFETFEQAEEFAQENDLDVVCLHKRDGWQLYERGEIAYEPFNIKADDYGDNYNMFKPSDLEDYYENEIKPCLDSFDNLEDLQKFLEDQNEIMDELENCDENEAVITYCGKLYERITAIRAMEFYHDTHYYVIGVMQYF